MANTILSVAEIAFLKKAVLDKYCEIVNEDVTRFTNSLTGSIKYYEYIAEVITDYLDKEDNLVAYINHIGESPLKIMLKKWLDGNARQRNMADGPAVSANILRKLIFDSQSGSDMAFKDFFVLGCYIFIQADRNASVKELKPVQALPKTIPPTDYNNENQPKGPVKKKSKFTLTPFENGTAADTGLEFDFKGNPVTLNRLNLDPDNNTITSKIQAKLSLKDGDWVIENFSEFNTTHIQVLRPTSIISGDIIIFGNKSFLFED